MAGYDVAEVVGATSSEGFFIALNGLVY